MSLKAGRRGLRKTLVDAFGQLKGNAPVGEYYTKTQTDEKFVTKATANSVFQPKTLSESITVDGVIVTTVEGVLQALNNLVNKKDKTPIGTIISFMGVTAPSGYLSCDGSILAISEYSDLADFIETQFGSVNFFGGNGTTTFAVPDLRGEFLRGTGTNSHANQGSGDNVGVHQNSTSIVDVAVSTNGIIYSHGETSLFSTDADGGTTPTETYRYNGTSTTTATTQYGRNPKINVRPTNTSVLYCIKAI